MKQCTKCKKTLPETEFYFRKDTKKLRNKCKNCTKNQSLKYYQENKNKVIKRVIEYNKTYRKLPHVRKKDNEYAKKYRKKYPEKIRERNKKDQDKRKQYDKNHPEIRKKINKKHREKYKTEHGKDISSKYYPRYKDKVREKTRKRRLKKKQLFEDFTIEEWQQKIVETKGICPLCDKPYSEVYPFIATIDHTPPVSKAPTGFHYTIKDVMPICGSCNSSKGAS